jgi:tetratricopeptide (TPR) repeat protein
VVYGPANAEFAAELAHHFDAAGEATKAVPYYRLAADRANELLDTDSSLRWYQRALDLAGDPGDQRLVGHCLTGIANAHRLRGEMAEAITSGLRALRVTEAAGDRTTKAGCLTMLGLLHLDKGAFEQSRRYLQESLALAKAADDRNTECIDEYMLSYTYFHQGRYDQAIAHGWKALGVARATGNIREEAESLIAVANYHLDLGEYELAIGHYQEALAIQRAIADQRGEAVSLLDIGLCHIELGAYEDARSPIGQALLIGRRVRGLRTQALAHHYLGLMHEGLHQPVEAARAYAAALRIRREVGQDALAIDSLAGLVRVALAEGDLPAARRDVDEILAWIAGHGTDGVEYPVRVYLTCVQALETLGDATRAEDAFQQACALLMERADRIADPALRRSFLERVPCNRELIALWRSRAGDVTHIGFARSRLLRESG